MIRITLFFFFLQSWIFRVQVIECPSLRFFQCQYKNSPTFCSLCVNVCTSRIRDDDRDADNFHDGYAAHLCSNELGLYPRRRWIILKLLLPEHGTRTCRICVDSEWEVRLYACITTGLTIRADSNDRRLQMNLFVLDNDGGEVLFSSTFYAITVTIIAVYASSATWVSCRVLVTAHYTLCA